MTNTNKIKIALLGATALFASTSAHAQVAAATAEQWTVGAGASGTSFDMSSTNSADVSIGSTDAPSTTNGAAIGADGDSGRNSVSTSAVGASASVSYSTVATSGAGTNATIEGASSVVATNDGGNISNVGDIQNSSIAAGTQNSISRAAVGSSASFSGSVFVAGGADRGGDLTTGGDILTAGNISVASTNGGGVTLQTDMGNADDGADSGPKIVAGNNNSISTSAVASSASVSMNALNVDGTDSVNFILGAGADTPTIEVSSTNDGGDVLVASTASDADPASMLGANIGAGNGNSISMMGVGSSASVGFSTTTYADAFNTTANLAYGDDGSVGTVSVSSTNANGVTVLANMGSADDVDSGATITAGTNNSISVGGIGASGSISLSRTDFSGATGGLFNTVQLASSSVVVSNEGAIAVTSSNYNPTIGQGYNNSISTSAVGASASAGLTNFIGASQ